MHPRLVFSVGASLGPTTEAEQLLTQDWNLINSTLSKWAPRENRVGPEEVSGEEIAARNIRLGELATDPIRWLCNRATPDDHTRRLADEKTVLYVGWGGFSFHGKWFRPVSLASLATCVLDVSNVGCESANTYILPVWEKMIEEKSFNPYASPKAPTIRQAEIQSVLIDPSSIDLDMNKVEWQIYCRVLSALGEEGTKIVAQIGGESLGIERDPMKHNRIITIDPHSENNPHRATKKSVRLVRRRILWDIYRGAGRPIRVEYEASYPYFGRVYTAMIIKAE